MPGLLSTVNSSENRLPAVGFSRLSTMNRVVLSPSVLMLGTRISSPYSAAVSALAMAAFVASPLSATNFAAIAVLAMAVAGRRNCFKKVSLWAMACWWLYTVRSWESWVPGSTRRFWEMGRSYTSTTHSSGWL